MVVPVLFRLVILAVLGACVPFSSSFQLIATTTTNRPNAFRQQERWVLQASDTSGGGGGGVDMNNPNLLLVRNYLKENYPSLAILLDKNDAVWKSLGTASSTTGFTILAPNANAFAALGNKKQSQLLDPRNLETTQKIASYHVVAERVTEEELFNAGGIITLGGQVPVDRSTSGGFFGVGGKEDGGVKVNNARVVQSFPLGTGIVHEVDDLVSPIILWRYMDQLRIPGSA